MVLWTMLEKDSTSQLAKGRVDWPGGVGVELAIMYFIIYYIIEPESQWTTSESLNDDDDVIDDATDTDVGEVLLVVCIGYYV